MSRFVWEPEDRLLVGDARPRPRTALDLLEALGVKNASRPAQTSAVNGWLVSADPDKLLQVSLNRKGFRAKPITWASPSVASPEHDFTIIGTGSIHLVPGTRPTGLDLFVNYARFAATGFAATGVHTGLADESRSGITLVPRELAAA